MKTVQDICGTGALKLHEPLFGPEEHVNVAQCVLSGLVSAGPWVEKFEAKLREFTGAKFAIATVSGTAALHAAVSCLWDKGDIIEIPALTFIATANAALQAGLVVHFTEPGEAVLPVDILGFPSEAVGRLRDSAQALGTEGITGTRIYSFNQNKTITTGGGGAIVTDDSELALRFKHITTTARIPHSWRVEHTEPAFNYRMPDINAALGCAQMDRLPDILKYKRALAMKYKEAFADAPEITFWDEPQGCRSNFWLCAIRLADYDAQQMALFELHNAGIQARMLPTPLHLLECYKDAPHNDLSVSEEIWATTICLPSSPRLGMQYA